MPLDSNLTTEEFGLSCISRPDMPVVQYARIIGAVRLQHHSPHCLPSKSLSPRFFPIAKRSHQKQESCAWEAIPNFAIRFCINMLGSSL